MITVTITHEDGISRTYNDVVAVDFIDRENCENVAGRELTDSELLRIRQALDKSGYLANPDDLRILVREIIESE